MELREDIGHVVAHRLQVDPQLVGDRRVPLPVGDEREHLTLALGQGRERRPRVLAALGEVEEDAVGDRGAEDRLTGSRCTNRSLDLCLLYTSDAADE